MPYVECVVTFIDILGFGEMVRADSTGEAVLRAVSRFRMYGTEDLDGRRHSLKGAAIQFSDCIVRCTPVRTEREETISDDVAEEIEDLTYLQGELAAEGILLRGGVAIGHAHIDVGGVFGPAMIEAYRLESEHAVHPRIVLHPDIMKRCGSVGDSGAGVYADDQVMLTRAADDGLHFVDYLRNFPREVHTENSPWREEIARGYMLPRKRLIERELARHPPLSTIRTKYAWLAGYHNDVALDILGGEADDVLIAL